MQKNKLEKKNNNKVNQHVRMPLLGRDIYMKGYFFIRFHFISNKIISISCQNLQQS